MTEAELTAKVAEVRSLRDRVAGLDFGNQDKDIFKGELIAIASNLLAVDLQNGFAPYSKEQFESYIGLTADWLRQLDNSFEYRLNAEMAYCIEKLVERWNLQQNPKRVIFTLGEFAVQKIKRNVNTQRIDYLLDMSQITGVPLSREPVFIRVPDEFKEHILANVPLLHEVGHFVDRDNCVTDIIYDDIMPKLEKRKSLKLKQNYFPRYEGVDIKTIAESPVVVKSHIEEYVADVFGAQFAGANILYYASYLQSKNPYDDAKDHPTLSCRKRLVNSFLEYGKSGRTLDIFLDSILCALNELKVSTCPFTEAQLLDANLQLTDTEQMFTIFGTSWNLVDREVRRNGIKKVGKVNYMQVLNLPYYQIIDANLKRMIRDLMGMA